ncbi:hypothetical protein [Roseiterribacter gracilis]|uniref:Uncharacterized protein n=1 Tax=Roseiterribacter gracilis TaxID=2812848 RepID=A0A8S8XBC2_9PROT|nr:hypothetical protein TMPK1_35150 [Rhodospirillales bacterium TMPK1]
MWAWAALLGGLAVVIAADLVGGVPANERRDVGRLGSESNLSPRDQRALALARNFADWHQAAAIIARSGAPPGEIPDPQIIAILPSSYAKAGAWRSVIDSDRTVRTSDDGATIAGIAVGGGAVGRFLAATVGYTGLAGVGWESSIAETRIDTDERADLTTPVLTSAAATGRPVRLTVRDNIDPSDKNVP